MPKHRPQAHNVDHALARRAAAESWAGEAIHDMKLVVVCPPFIDQPIT